MSEPTAAEARLLELLTHERRYRDLVGDSVLRVADVHGGAIPLELLGNFELPDGTRRRLIDGGGGGIWNPGDLMATLAITTSPDGPYADHEADDGILHYRYQGTNPEGKNTKLRRAMEFDLPLIRFQKIAPGYYTPIYPVHVVGDDPFGLTFHVSVDARLRLVPSDSITLIERAYAERIVRARVHQPAFRARVLLAYGDQCAICRLKHPRLLDAAHIISDSDDWGDPVVPNGIALCKIHHAAYDGQFLGIDGELRVHINATLLEEVDGPMLKHGIQEMHGARLSVPRSPLLRPDRARLESRYAEFLTAG